MAEVRIVNDHTVRLRSGGPQIRDMKGAKANEISLAIGESCSLGRGGPPAGGDGVLWMKLTLLGIENDRAVFHREQLWFSERKMEDRVEVPAYRR